MGNRLARVRVRPLLSIAIAGVAAALLLGALFAAFPDSADAAAVDPPLTDELVLPMTPAREGGDGIDNAGTSEWVMLAVTLGPFSVLISGLIWLTFRIDKSEGRE